MLGRRGSAHELMQAEGMLPIRPFASEFVAGVRREAGQVTL